MKFKSKLIVFAKIASAGVQLLLLAAASTGLAPGYKTSCPHFVFLEPANGTSAVCGLLVEYNQWDLNICN